MFKARKSEVPTDKSHRRRGRPAGKNRKPLSLEERRARNAQYERERRNETADAMAQLAEAVCCDPQISNAELLATVISKLQRRAKKKVSEKNDNLKRIIVNLESEILDLQRRLGPDSDLLGDLDEDLNDSTPDQLDDDTSSNSKTEEPQTQRAYNSQRTDTIESLSDFQSTSEVRRSRKIRKTSKSSSVSGAYETKSESKSDSESEASTSQSAPKQYQLRQRRQKVSENTTSTYLYESETDTSQNGVQVKNEVHYDFDPSDVAVNPANASEALSAIPDEYAAPYEDALDTVLIETLTDGETQLINEWFDCNETLNTSTDQDNWVQEFLDFDNFLLDINA